MTTLLDQSWGQRDIFIAIVGIMSFVSDRVEIIIGLQHTSRDGLGLRVGISVSGRTFSLFYFLVIMVMMSILILITRAAYVLIFLWSAGFCQSQQPAFVVYHSDSCNVEAVTEIK